MLFGWHNPSTIRNGLLSAFIATSLGLGLLFFSAIEGLICILMALPIVCPLALLGGILGFFKEDDGTRARKAKERLNEIDEALKNAFNRWEALEDVKRNFEEAK